MRTLYTLLLLVFFSFSNAQNSKVCKNIVSEVVTAFNNKSADKITKYLASDFTFLDQKEPMAKMILSQLFMQMDNRIKKYTLKKENKSGNLTLIYEIVYTGIGTEKSTFVFNKKNQIVFVEFFKAKVKMGLN